MRPTGFGKTRSIGDLGGPVTGHDFSRADKANRMIWALAPCGMPFRQSDEIPGFSRSLLSPPTTSRDYNPGKSPSTLPKINQRDELARNERIVLLWPSDDRFRTAGDLLGPVKAADSLRNAPQASLRMDRGLNSPVRFQ